MSVELLTKNLVKAEKELLAELKKLECWGEDCPCDEGTWVAIANANAQGKYCVYCGGVVEV